VKKPTRQARSFQQSAAAFTAQSTLTVGATYIVHGSRNKHGSTRKEFGPLEYAQAAIRERYPSEIPERINTSRLTVMVNKRLDRDPKYKKTKYGKLSRQTVMRALATLRAGHR
jgi:hypothetical protein